MESCLISEVHERTQWAVVMLMAGWVTKALRHLDDAMVFYMLPVGVTPELALAGLETTF